MDTETFTAVVDEAKLAPSAHNTQPVRWALHLDGSILILADLTRRLAVGDPHDRDLMIACGAAVEGTILALAQRGYGGRIDTASGPDTEGLRPLAAVIPTGVPDPDDVVLGGYVRRRLTHRLGFDAPDKRALDELGDEYVTIVRNGGQIAWLSDEIDRASARIMQDRHFRAELLYWMRLSRRDPRYSQDGLNSAALAMNTATAVLTRPVIGSPMYTILSALGLGPALSGEAAKSREATAILLFHWPNDGPMIDAGRAFYRTWLRATALGLAGWPAAALADDPASTKLIKERYGLPDNQTLFNTLRVGPANGPTPHNTRLATSEVIVRV